MVYVEPSKPYKIKKLKLIEINNIKKKIRVGSHGRTVFFEVIQCGSWLTPRSLFTSHSMFARVVREDFVVIYTNSASSQRKSVRS